MRDRENDSFNLWHQRTEELYHIRDVDVDADGLIDAPVLPLRDMVVYPRFISPAFIDRAISVNAVKAAHEWNQTLVALIQLDENIESPKPGDFHHIGVELAVGKLIRMPDGGYSALVQARRRVMVKEIVLTEPYIRVRALPLEDDIVVTKSIDALMRTAVELFDQCVQLDRSLPEEAYFYALNINQPGWLADLIATSIVPKKDVRIDVLNIIDPVDRLKYVIDLLKKEIEVLELEDEIQAQTQRAVDRTQREFYLREQMKVIQRELGEADPFSKELSELVDRIRKAKMPTEVEMRALKEASRLAQLPPISPESGIIRTYIDWILELPWHKKTEDNLDVTHAAKVLDEYHYGLEKAKERVLEYIAVESLKPEKLRQPILCFVGPPGTGKTSLGKSIAIALGRKFVRISLGGIKDEAEIRGHRRTYIGALPGRIIQTMRRAGTINPLFMLDEIDKLGNDFRGDPASALLEVLDPEQNHSFSDHYLELPYDLSNVFFITTANTVSTIPDALLDRMEVIEFPGYIEEDKVEIAQRFLIPRQLRENGLSGENIVFTESAIKSIIRDYTYEAGVRNLEREIGKICRKLARKKAEGKRLLHKISPNQLERFLGPPQYFNFEAERKDEIGVAMAVAWTVGGGEIMPIEVLIMEGKGGFQMTGQLGNIMQESIQAALSYIKSRNRKLGIDPEIYDQVDIHLHIPEGAIPKDGPSAGITITSALASALTDRPVRCDIGMTGEITLRGNILPVGGIKEKILAAYRAGLKQVLIPQKNTKDLVDVPKKVKSAIVITPVSHMDEVLSIALLPKSKGNGKKSKSSAKAE